MALSYQVKKRRRSGREGFNHLMRARHRLFFDHGYLRGSPVWLQFSSFEEFMHEAKVRPIIMSFIAANWESAGDRHAAMLLSDLESKVFHCEAWATTAAE